MKKKNIYFIIGGLVLITIGIFLLPKYSDYDKNKIVYRSEEFIYQTIKTKNVSEKTLLSFPIFLKMNEIDSSDYLKEYIKENEENSTRIYATELESTDDLDTVLNKIIESNKQQEINHYIEEDIEIESEFIKKDFKAKLIKFDRTDEDEITNVKMLVALVKLSSTDYAEVIYTVKNGDMSTDDAKELLKNFNITRDGEYRIGHVDINELIFELELTPPNGKKYSARISLDSNQYVELEDKYNSKEHTKISNINSGEKFEIFLFYSSNKLGRDILESLEVELIYNEKYKYEISSFKESNVFETSIYEATSKDAVVRVYRIDDEGCFVIIAPKNYGFMMDFENVYTEVNE